MVADFQRILLEELHCSGRCIMGSCSSRWIGCQCLFMLLLALLVPSRSVTGAILVKAPSAAVWQVRGRKAAENESPHSPMNKKLYRLQMSKIYPTLRASARARSHPLLNFFLTGPRLIHAVSLSTTPTTLERPCMTEACRTQLPVAQL